MGVVRSGLRSWIETEDDFIVSESWDWQSTLESIKKYKPDILISESKLNGISGSEFVENVLKRNADLLCISYSRFCSASHVKSMIKAGVKGYFHYTSGKEQVIAAIKTVLQGEVYLCLKSASAVSEEIKNGANHGSLTKQEETILTMVADGYSSKAIADLLCLSLSTIKTHRKNIMNKLDIHEVANLAKYAVLKNLTTLE